MGSLEAAKMTDTLACPLSGEIRAVNDAAMKNPAIVNRDPYGDGWIAELRPARWDAERELFASGSRIAEYGDAESARLQDPSASRS
jgi:glycine cleavage system H protein